MRSLPAAAAAASLAVGRVLAAWALALGVETVVIAVVCHDLFAGAWETAAARKCALPIALAALVPFAPMAVVLGDAIARSERRVLARWVLSLAALGFAAATGYGVTFGRHFASWTLRGPFIVALSLVGWAAAFAVAPWLARFARRTPAAAAVAGFAVAVALAVVDATVLPRLYPAFHGAVFALAVAAAAAVALLLDGPFFGGVGLALGALAVAWSVPAARRLHGADNLRLVLSERAPSLGRGVALAMALLPPPPDEGPADDTPAAGAGGGALARALDWTGRDILLVTVDALRADHVSAYGYPRRTTPHLDALAAEGALFEAAYCPTPHTSYSVTSLMTGKYMRPLLAMGRGEDSDTLATFARRYGLRTAAFYPPAVFFIDEERFTGFRDRGLDFEYRKVEFTDPQSRAAQLEAYLAGQGATPPLLLWVHFFEPHEPYVPHPAFPFGDPAHPTDVDAYDSEIAAADDGIGRVVRAVRARRPGAVVVVTADHGEEFGDHGGRYHGTTVYEEQVRVPLVVAAPGVAPARIATVVQTIDVLPTVLSALGIPRPPRVRGRDLGPTLAGKGPPGDPGFAFAETDGQTLVAKGGSRLLCQRRVAACTLHRPAVDPLERRDLAAVEPDHFRALQREGRAVAAAHGRFEPAPDGELPEALRRGLQGDGDAAEDVAALLDDASAAVRAKAAEVLFDLAAPASAPSLRRAERSHDDETVRRFAALTLVRLGEGPTPRAAALVADGDRAWRRRAALAFAERGDGRGGRELHAWWVEEGAAGLGFDRAKEVLTALGRIRWTPAVPVLVASLDDVRLRPFVAETLGAIGDGAARKPLLEAFARERYVHVRPVEGRALLALGVREDLRAPLTRFAGTPEPMEEAITLARQAGLLEGRRASWVAPPAGPSKAATAPSTSFVLRAPQALTEGGLRLLVEGESADATLAVYVRDRPVEGLLRRGAVAFVDIAGEGPGADVPVHVEGRARAAWLVPRAPELPPPPPSPWQPGRQGPSPLETDGGP